MALSCYPSSLYFSVAEVDSPRRSCRLCGCPCSTRALSRQKAPIGYYHPCYRHISLITVPLGALSESLLSPDRADPSLSLRPGGKSCLPAPLRPISIGSRHLERSQAREYQRLILALYHWRRSLRCHSLEIQNSGTGVSSSVGAIPRKQNICGERWAQSFRTMQRHSSLHMENSDLISSCDLTR